MSVTGFGLKVPLVESPGGPGGCKAGCVANSAGGPGGCEACCGAQPVALVVDELVERALAFFCCSKHLASQQPLPPHGLV